jgi:hypothetical protein
MRRNLELGSRLDGTFNRPMQATERPSKHFPWRFMVLGGLRTNYSRDARYSIERVCVPLHTSITYELGNNFPLRPILKRIPCR